MRFVFNAMLAVALAVVVAGLALGMQARRRLSDDASAGAARGAELRHGGREWVPQARRERTQTETWVSVESTIAPPMPLSPRYAAEVSGPPRLAWRLAEGTDGARVELCPTNDFDETAVRRVDAGGEQVTLPSPWPSGVWYWRLRGRTRADVGDRATPTWMLYVRGATTASAGAGDLGAIALHVESKPSPWLITHEPPPGTLLPIYDLRVRDPADEPENDKGIE
jgi:hypothetical protein